MPYVIEKLVKGEELARCIDPLARYGYITIVKDLLATEALKMCDKLALTDKGRYRVIHDKNKIVIYNIETK